MKIVYPQLTMVSLAQIPGSRITRSSSPSCRILVTEIPRLVAALANPNETFVNGRRRFDCWWTAPASDSTRSSPNASSIEYGIQMIRLLSLDTRDIYCLVKLSATMPGSKLNFISILLFSGRRNSEEFHVTSPLSLFSLTLQTSFFLCDIIQIYSFSE